MPDNADSSDVRTQIKKLKGGVAVVENTATMIGDQQFAGDNWSFKHVGGEPNESLVALLQRSTYEIFSACGVNPSLISPGDGAGQRESWRQYLLAVVSPLGRVVQSELRRKLDSPDLVLKWDELRASDLASRARGFASMVNGGMELDRAAALAGLLEQDD